MNDRPTWTPDPDEMIESTDGELHVNHDEVDRRIRDLADQLAEILDGDRLPGPGWLVQVERLPLDRTEALDRIRKLNNQQRPGEALTRKE